MDGNITENDESITEDSSSTNTQKASSSFRIIEANINSLKGKKEELNALIENENPDILILVETKLDNNYRNSEFFDTNEWNIVVRKDRNCYGVIIAVRRKFTASPVIINYDDPSGT